MVHMTTGKGVKRETVPNELVGLSEPTPFIGALLSFTAKMNREHERHQMVTEVKATAPTDSLARQIKAGSLNPSIYHKVPK